MLLKENELKYIKLKAYLDEKYNYISVFYNDELIHKEKINVLKYENRKVFSFF